MKKVSSLDKWIVRKHGKIKRFLPHSNKEINNIKYIFTKQQLDQRITLRRQQQRTQQLTLLGDTRVHKDLKSAVTHNLSHLTLKTVKKVKNK